MRADPKHRCDLTCRAHMRAAVPALSTDTRSKIFNKTSRVPYLSSGAQHRHNTGACRHQKFRISNTPALSTDTRGRATQARAGIKSACAQTRISDACSCALYMRADARYRAHRRIPESHSAACAARMWDRRAAHASLAFILTVGVRACACVRACCLCVRA